MKSLEEVRALEDYPKLLQECVDIFIGLQRTSGKVAEILTILEDTCQGGFSENLNIL
jgi:hypothetical protein